jgi:hypothetical protein
MGQRLGRPWRVATARGHRLAVTQEIVAPVCVSLPGYENRGRSFFLHSSWIFIFKNCARYRSIFENMKANLILFCRFFSHNFFSVKGA